MSDGIHDQQKGLEIKIGAFVLAGLAAIVLMVIHFGRLGEGLRPAYSLSVEFPNASGLLKGSAVLYGGANVGRVSEEPRITNNPQVIQASSAVVVVVKIYEDVPVPEGSQFFVGSSGLLGDRFVDVVPPENFRGDTYVQPGSVLAGSRIAGIDDITREGVELIKDLRGAVTNIDSAVKRVDRELLKESNVKAFEETLTGLRTATSNISISSEKLTDVVQTARSAMVAAESTMKSGELAVTDIRATIKDVRSAIGTAKLIMNRGLHGDGLIARLFSDETIATDLSALLANLKRHGILFYRDNDGKPERVKTAPSATPARTSPGSRGVHPNR